MKASSYFKRKNIQKPNLRYEKRFWKKGFKIVAGVDEVGRGCFAGPVAAAAVAFAPMINDKWSMANEKGKKIIINDSKKLTRRQRERADKWIRRNAISWGIGKVTAKTINRYGMAKATQMAFRRAVNNANRKLENRSKNRIQFLLIDHFFAPYIRGLPMARKKARKNRNLKDSRAKQMAIVNGDERSVSIAAASIVAKVYRDSLMEKLGKRARYKKYDWGNNKGYATRVHQGAILKYGICGYHRKQFVETFLKNLAFRKAHN